MVRFPLNRGACDSNEQHDAEITSERSAAEQDMMTNIEDTLQQVDSESILYSVSFFEIDMHLSSCIAISKAINYMLNVFSNDNCYISCNNNAMLVYNIVGISKQERGSISGILDAVKTHTETIEAFRNDHSCQASAIEEKAKETFRQQYMVSYCYTLKSIWLILYVLFSF